jgi:hypothetical protein
MTDVTIAGQTYAVGLLSWYQVEQGWPAIAALQKDPDPVLASGHFFEFLSGILGEEHPELADVGALKRRVKMVEMVDIGAAVRAILIENTLIATPGEPNPPEAPASLSTDDATDSSPSSSPPE